tara:strand:+ start:371 stop:1030 length:660 start_codon:yes stop_codon:yes gene_type:complete
MAEKKKTQKTPKKKPVKKMSGKKASAQVHMPSLRKVYKEEIIPSLQEQFNYSNVMEVPMIVSISINMGVGDAKINSKSFESAVEEITLITGQKPIVTIAKKDISNFKIRRGFPVGTKVTLRGDRMYEFLERLIMVALPRTRDFRGLSHKSFDGRGNYNFGIKEQIIFTEINYDKIDAIRGLNVSISTTSNSDDEAYWLLKSLGLPLKEKPVKQEVEEAA